MVYIKTYLCVCSKGVCVVVLYCYRKAFSSNNVMFFCDTKTGYKTFESKVKQENSHLTVEVAICFRRKGVAWTIIRVTHICKRWVPTHRHHNENDTIFVMLQRK